MKVALVILLFALTIVSANKVSVNAPLAGDTDKTHLEAYRNKRAAACGVTNTLTSAQAADSINAHNTYRAREPATNMFKAFWNDDMGARAQEWVNQCIWGHGVKTDCSGNTIGQNMYIERQSSGYPTLNFNAVMESWWNEKSNWDWATSTCAAGKVCGHWTQLVAAQSYQVGCAYALCPSINVDGVVWTNALLVGCDYNPTGNNGSPIYEKGTVCTHCDYEGLGGGFKCDNNLCVRCTPSTDPACACGTPLACVNGSWNTGSCSCACNKGYYGLKCEKSCTCVDKNAQCNQLVQYCTMPDYQQFMTDTCQKTCTNLCNPPPSCAA